MDSRLLTRIIHERCCDKPTGGGLAPRSLEVLHEYASEPLGSARRSRDAAWRFRPSIPRPRSGSSLSGVEGSTVLGTLSLSNGRRTVMTNAG